MHMNGHKQIKRKKWVYAWKDVQKMSEIPTIAYIDEKNFVWEKEDRDKYVRIGKVKYWASKNEVIYE